MTVNLTATKATKVRSACQNLLFQKTTTIRSVAQVVGFLVSSFPAVEYAEMHYRHLELDKISALRANKGNFDSIMALSVQSKIELTWWVNNVRTASKPIMQPWQPWSHFNYWCLKCGLGSCLCGDTSTGGFWSLEEQRHHINFLELKAVLLGLKLLCGAFSEKHVFVQSDNTTTVVYINAMGGIKSIPSNEMATMIWDWCLNHNIWLSATHISSSKNTQADKESRVLKESTEWSLTQEVFNAIQER